MYQTINKKKNSHITSAGNLNWINKKNVMKTSASPVQDESIVQRAIADDDSFRQNNYYEINGHQHEGVFHGRRNATYGDTAENGYTRFLIEDNEMDEWSLASGVLEFTENDGSIYIAKTGNFRLPVSCIESAEHIVHYLRPDKNAALPHWDSGQGDEKSVTLEFGFNGLEENKLINISDTAIDDAVQGDDWGNLRENIDDVALGEGLLAIDPTEDEPLSTLHAVAVVGKNNIRDQIIVLERNAGTMTGDENFTDASWVLNIYDGIQGFRASFNNANVIIGKLK